MSVEVERPARDYAVQASRVVLAIILPAIFIAFCILAYFAKPPAPAAAKSAMGVDLVRTGSTPPPVLAAAPAAAVESGYGIDY